MTTSRVLRSPARVLAVVAALLGIVLMHGLAGHGTAHAGHAGHGVAAVAAPVPGHADHAAHAVAPVDHAGAPADDVAAATSDGGAAAGLAGLCLAVLATGLLAFLVAAVGRPGRGWTARAVGAAARRGVRPAADRPPGPRPPDLHALGVLRC